MKTISLVLWLVAIAFAAGCNAGSRVDFVKTDNKIDVTIDGKHFASYLFGGPYKVLPEAGKTDYGFLAKPILLPIKTPSGITVTRGYPLKHVEGQSYPMGDDLKRK